MIPITIIIIHTLGIYTVDSTVCGNHNDHDHGNGDYNKCSGHLQCVCPSPLRPTILRHLHRHTLLLGHYQFYYQFYP